MKKLIIILSAVLSIAACSKAPAGLHPDWTYNSVVYEVNIRQYTPEGTFRAFEAELPRLKDLGVDVLWLMPMYRIGTEGRKGTLGSYYAIADYKSVNPEFGTMEDFEHLLAEAHKLGFKVILDWVANQTSPDNVWMSEKPAEFYEMDENGNAIWEYDWTDTRSLNYECKGVWEAQDDAMRFWLEKGVDGFRCDAAGDVPAEFWKGILPKIKADYPGIYLLAEAERDNIADPRETFDANYAWELHHLLNAMAKGYKSFLDLVEYVERDAERFTEVFRLTFTSNHDENSWAGTEFEREGAAANACAVLCFTLPNSQPLVYTGQEIGLDRRLQFFEKDSITDWSPNEQTAFWKRLIEIKHNNPALAAGERGGELNWLDAPAGFVAYSRSLPDNKVIVIANFGTVPTDASEEDVEVAEANDNRPQGIAGGEPFLNLKAEPVACPITLDAPFTNAFTGEVLEGEVFITLAPGEFVVLTK